MNSGTLTLHRQSDSAGSAAGDLCPQRFCPVSNAIMSSMQYYPEEIIAYAMLSTGRFCNAIVSARTHAHSVVSAPVQNRPCSKLKPLP